MCALLATLAFGVAACAVKTPPPPSFSTQQPERWDAELALPVAEDRNASPSIVEVDLEARLATLEVKPGVKTELWTYNGSVPGPILRAKKGDRLLVHFTNHLPEPTTVHWHGLRVPAAMDGSEMMQDPVPPGGSFDYSFELPDAGTYWYHPHINSSAQVGYGLYGAVIVEDPAEPKLGDDLVLVLSDLSLEDDGSLSPGDDNGWFGDYFGREGALLLVNGKLRPKLKGRVNVPQRWRVINAARSRYQKLTLPGQTLMRVASDGGLIESPKALSDLVLAPGERADVIVSPSPQPDGPMMALLLDYNRFNVTNVQPPVPIFSFDVVPDGPLAAPPLPAKLRDIAPIDTTGALQRTVELMEMEDGGESVLGINGKTTAHAGHGEMFYAHVNTTEVWELNNATDYVHPFHLHGFFFQVLEVDGQPWTRHEWKDTFTLRPHQKARIAITFDDRPGTWMFHCHILDHADLGMMGMLMLMEH
jgi:FtsP/CotA-like multicopper oxidase with cupredoxin domain